GVESGWGKGARKVANDLWSGIGLLNSRRSSGAVGDESVAVRKPLGESHRHRLNRRRRDVLPDQRGSVIYQIQSILCCATLRGGVLIAIIKHENISIAQLASAVLH